VVQALCNFTASPIPRMGLVVRHLKRRDNPRPAQRRPSRSATGSQPQRPTPTPWIRTSGEQRPRTSNVIGNADRAAAGEAGRAHTDRAREAQPDSHTLPQLAAKLAECHL
jgi:hypothetical protein